jgi:citronellol/citronellal dehydrogenase
VIFVPDLLLGQVAVVTGGGSGIGRGIALELARAGADIVLAGRRQGPLQDVAAEVEALGRRALAHPADVREWEQVRGLMAAAVQTFGRLDILVNNAGGQFGAAFAELSPRGWKSVIELNLNGVFHCTRAAADHLLPQRRGKVINIVAGFSRRAAPNVSHSGAARAAVENLTRSLALEWAPHNVQVNCVSPIAMTEAFARNSGPGGVERVLAQVPSGRAATLEEVGWLVVYLASRGGDMITGEHIVMDGGYWLSTAVGGPRPPVSG